MILNVCNICLSAELTQATQLLTNIVEDHRKIIFLLSFSDERDDVRDRDTFIARNHYYQKRELLERFEHSIVNAESKNRETFVNSLFSTIGSDDIRAADLLAFTELVDNIIFYHQENPFLGNKQYQQLSSISSEINRIEAFYETHLREISSKLGTRGKSLERWESYINFLNNRYKRSELRKHFNSFASDLKEPELRGAGKSNKKDPGILWGFNVPEKTVVLTFDDGPHYRHTDMILDTLKEYNAKAYFFAVGKNFGSTDENKPVLKKNADKLQRALKEGHKLGNHSFTHRVLTKLEEGEQLEELKNTNTLLEVVAKSKNTVFRPPYGSKDEDLQALTISQGMRSVMWNVDSMDWGDPIPDSIASRVIEKVEKNKRGIILFHDIHQQTVKALPKVLKELTEKGYRFVDVDGNDFSAEPNKKKDKTIATTDAVKKESEFYKSSWAVVIGINEYDEWPKLSYAVNDAVAIRDVLTEKYGFKPDNIFTLFNKDANRDSITELLGDTLADPQKVKPDDRVFIFYAGHGMTRKLPSGRDLGYIIPVDAALDKFHTRSISMTHLRDFSEMIPAKHVYFVMDSCYSGIALTRSGSPAKHGAYLEEITKRNARQILTAGGADQEVADGGPGGHSIFTWTLLQGLNGSADLDKNNIITASELGAFVAPAVSAASNQTPAFGNMVGSEGGDFVFELETFNKENIANPKSEADKLAELQRALDAANKRNKELEIALTQATSIDTNTATASSAIKTMSPKDRKALAITKHEQGLKYYKAKQFDEALTYLKEAVELSPSNSSIVNNYGFVLYEAGKYEESLQWLEKTIELEPKRTVVYLNIADTLKELKREKDSIPYYEHYLELFPSSPKAEEIEAKINAIKNSSI